MVTVNVIGAGLAGSECALQLARRGIKVKLFDMKPEKMSAAHSDTNFAELVCSNSLKSNDISTAGGLLKQELRALGSELIDCADKTSVPAGGALAVDRKLFALCVTEKIKSNPNIDIVNETVSKIPSGVTVIATGPLTDESLFHEIKRLCGNEKFLYFFDAAAPIVDRNSIDFNLAFISDRYDKGTGDYINCPLNKEEFEIFHSELVKAQTAKLKDFEESKIFEGCMPLEVMAKRGTDTIRFGPFKPVGLTDPKTGKRPYAVLQLRKENNFGSLYNLVGCQTNLTFPEQKRVFGLIPALKNAEFLRYGVMHKNTYINSPALLSEGFSLRSEPDMYFAGQISGVEGYVESIASGLVVALSVLNRAKGLQPDDFASETMTGALAKYISSPSVNFQPMNANFGILPPLETHERDKAKRKQLLAERALKQITIYSYKLSRSNL